MTQPHGTRVRYTRQAAAVVAVMSGMPAFSDARDIRTVEVDGREVWEWAREVASLAGFTLTGHMVGLTGVCPAHAGAARDASAPGTPGLADARGRLTGTRPLITAEPGKARTVNGARSVPRHGQSSFACLMASSTMCATCSSVSEYTISRA